MTDADKNIFPEINLGIPDPVARIKKIGMGVVHFITQRHSEVPSRGGADMLDRMLYDLPPYVPQPKQQELWDETSN